MLKAASCALLTDISAIKFQLCQYREPLMFAWTSFCYFFLCNFVMKLVVQLLTV